MKKVILDCLGGDHLSTEVASGLLSCLHYPLDFVLVGEEAKLRPIFEKKGVDMSRFEFIDASYTLSNDEDPRALVRGKEDSSLVQAMLRLKQEDAIAYIGAGSTGATLLASIFRLGLLPSVKFPALGCFLYSYKKEKVCLLDCGANIDMAPSLALKFARLGEAVVRAYLGIGNPRIGLLNVGKEEHKGNAFCKEAYGLLKDSKLNFIGNVEGSDILLGKADVVLTDGFAGNVALKAIESTALICKDIALSNGDERSACQIDETFHFTDRGASMVFGAKKIVLKMHGSAKGEALSSCIEMISGMEKGRVLDALAGLEEKDDA